MSRIAPDAVIDGRYQVLGHLGTGGMAEVYCAHDLQLERKVALKLLHDRFAQDAEFVERFRREASSAAGLQHQYVVSVYDRGEYDGTPYIAMEYVQGRTLKALVHENGALDPARAVDLTVQILRAARFAHRRGVIHRDFKPQNVIVDDEGRAKVTDFGIARAGASDMTQTGSIMGTAQYLSPEQAQGHAVNARSDLYSIGIILYELLTGRVPFDAESAVTVALKQVSETPIAPRRINPAIPPELEEIVLRAIAKDPAERFADADAFIDALESAVSRIPTPAAMAAAEAAAASLPATAGTIVAPPMGPPPGGATHVLPPAAAAYASDGVTKPPHPLPPLPERNKRWPWIVGALIALAIVIALVMSWGPDQVNVPNVVGSQISNATQRLRSEGFAVAYVRDVSDKPRNTVVGQDPGAGESVDEGAKITLNISDGQPLTRVPDVVGKGRREARKTLTDAGFEVQEQRVGSDTVPLNRVISQSPPEKSQVAKGETVRIVVSTGPQQVEVPSVVGKSERDARAALEAAGLRANVVGREDDEADPGTVLEQNPARGATAPRGSAVTITVAEEAQQVTVPDVTGRSRAQARAILTGRGLKVAVEEAPADSVDGDGVVQSQSPGGDEKVDRGTEVTITVGVFDPELDPEPSTTTTTPATTTTVPG